ncbi:MAG: GNAT family N-acetyltransferase [Streptosporangiaceae bacterium]
MKQIAVPVEIAHTASEDPAVISLCSEQAATLKARYPDDAEAPMPVDSDVTFLLARIEGIAAGCACLQPLTPEIAEARRVFVTPDQRGQGVSRLLLIALEDLAASRGHLVLRLETGDLQPEAIGLYQAAGFRRVPRYAPYLDSPRSICFEKDLG